MALLLDSGIVYAYYDRDDRWHDAAFSLLEAEPGPLIVPTVVAPEVDHLLGTRIGRAAQAALYDDLADRVYLTVALEPDDLGRIRDLNRMYDDLGLGFVDAAVATVAERLEVSSLATADRKHFPAIGAEIPLELVPEPPVGS